MAEQKISQPQLLFFSTEMKIPEERLLEAVKTLVPEERFEICRTRKELFQKLRLRVNSSLIAILFVAKNDDLEDILSLRELFHDVKIILVLPNRQNHTISKAHTLRPRFLTYINGDLSEIVAVLGKML